MRQLYYTAPSPHAAHPQEKKHQNQQLEVCLLRDISLLLDILLSNCPVQRKHNLIVARPPKKRDDWDLLTSLL